MGECPACTAMPLSQYEAKPGVQVDLCTHCRGLFLDRHEIKQLVGRGSLSNATEVVPVTLGEDIGMRCPKCVTPAMQPLRVKGAEDARSWQCRSCGGLWLGDGAFVALARSLRAAGPAYRILPPRESEHRTADRDDAGLAYSRMRYDEGLENLVGMPIALLLSALVCASSLGTLFASMVGMPFHELGHAAASWLSSRIAVPLPFFTFWLNDQSWFMGAVMAGALGWWMFHTHREGNRFMFGATVVAFVAWGTMTFVISPSTTLMWQILAGVLGEIIFGAFLLVAFHFPLPDRFRWDFWRWLALFPAALCFTHALLLWRRVAADVSQMPWGSAIGAESDGDMNRLVQQFGWSANDLAELYLSVGYGALAALVAAYGYAVFRYWRRASDTRVRRPSQAPVR